MSKKKVLVCGASGVIGRNTAEHLASKDNYDVYGTYLTRKYKHDGITLIQTDLTDRASVYRVVEGMDAVVQCAAVVSGMHGVAGDQPHKMVTDNVIMGSLVLRAAHDLSIPQLVLLSSNTIYQQTEPRSGLPVRETDLDKNQLIKKRYVGMARTKIYLEEMCEFYSGLGKTKQTVIRPANIYGMYDKFDLERSHLLSATITKVLNAKSGSIDVSGNGQGERDLLYASDIANLIEIALEKQEKPFDVFNAGSGHSISIDGLIRKIISISGKDLEIKYDNKPSLQTRLILDTSKAREQLGWQPEVSLDEGLRRTMDWCKKQN